jgi:hypothetical protein
MVVEEELVRAPRQWSKKFDKFMVDRYLSIPVPIAKKLVSYIGQINAMCDGRLASG